MRRVLREASNEAWSLAARWRAWVFGARRGEDEPWGKDLGRALGAFAGGALWGVSGRFGACSVVDLHDLLLGRFPAFGLLTSGIAGLSEGRPVRVSEAKRERELLEAIRESGEISAAAAAARTSLTVAEVDRSLRELAENGHLEVRARGGAIFYALWANGGRPGGRSRVRRELGRR